MALATSLPAELPASTLSARAYLAVREQSAALCAPLAIEDYGPQSMAEASPAKWHLAHTTWFFERFVLRPHLPEYRCFHERFDDLFNSYYHSVGPQHPRSMRGLLSRPTVAEIYRYRAHVDEQLQRLLESGEAHGGAIAPLTELGLHHEQQHQELLLTDIKHLLSLNPMHPPYRSQPRGTSSPAPLASGAARLGATLQWRRYAAALHEIGADAGRGFCFDNESPRHQCYTAAFALADRPVSNAEFREFIGAGGYREPQLWLSDGWQLVQSQDWQRPLYWSADLQGEFTLGGDAPLEPAAPVCHLSYYEADAFAHWAGARLPTEAEWEYAAAHAPLEGNLLESGLLRPQATAPAGDALRQLYGDVWEWSASAYLPYPGFRPWPGSLGEYNGKFMANQFVLRGGSCVTPRTHIRASYRNFFAPASRWQFTGIRLAKDS